MNGWQLENGSPSYVESHINECKTFIPILPNQPQIPNSTDANKKTDSNSSSKYSTDKKERHLVIGKEIEDKK